MKSHIIRTLLEELSEEAEEEVLQHINSILQRDNHGLKSKKFDFGWEGDLSCLKEKFTSVELQHKALEWR